MALSAVYRTGERFGAGHVVDVLLGAQTERIRALGHESLTVYGLGKDLDRAQWRTLFRQLTSLGFLVPDAEGHGGLRLGPDDLTRPLLRGERRLELRVEAAELSRRRSAWVTPTSPYPRGYGRLFASHVSQAHEGCDFDFLQAEGEIPDPDIH